MAVPSLRIPLSLNMDEFQKNVESAKSHTRQATQFLTKQFLDANTEIAASAGAAGTRWALGWAGKIALVVGSIKLMGDAIGAVRGQLDSMLEIGEKSRNTGLSPEFWQSWVEGAKGAEKQIALFEGALDNAYQSLKPILNPNWTVWDEGLTKVTAVEEAMRGMRELFTNDQDFSGFQLFRDADTQEKKIAAVLTYMKQLQAIGQDVAALDLGEKVFGAKFADQIRNNQQSIDQLLDNIKTKTPDAFSNEIVNRAKDLDTQLNNAWRTIDQNLHPSMEALDSLALNLKEVWVGIVELMAKAAKLLNPTITGTNSAAVQLSATGEPGLQTPIMDGTITGNDAPPPTRVVITGGTVERIPLPRRRPLDAPKTPPPPGVQDRFETSADQIEKRAAALEAEAKAIGMGNAAREQAKITAQLETVARQANAAAGKGENVITEEQRLIIDKLAVSYGTAAQEVERMKVASSISFGKQTAFLSAEDVAIAQQLRGMYGDDVPRALASTEAAALRSTAALRDLNDTGRDLSRGFAVEFGQSIRNGASAWESFEKAGITALGRISDKLFAMAGDKLWESALGGLTGSGGLFGGGGASRSPIMVGDYSMPRFAAGTDFAPGGLSLVGENGPELMNVPRGAQIIPNDILRQSSSAGGAITYAPQIDLRGASVEAVTKLEQVLARDKATFETRVRTIVSRRGVNRW